MTSAYIVGYNIDHPAPDGFASVELFPELSNDAVPSVVARIDVVADLPQHRDDRLVRHLCADRDSDSWRRYNRSRDQSIDATNALCATTGAES